MPYKQDKRKIFTFTKASRWKKKQTCGSVAKAGRALKLLRKLEHDKQKI